MKFLNLVGFSKHLEEPSNALAPIQWYLTCMSSMPSGRKVPRRLCDDAHSSLVVFEQIGAAN